jgi:Mobilization protein NikA
MTTDNLAESGDQHPKKKRIRSNKRQRDCQYVVRCTRDEFNEIAANARPTGFKTTAWLRGRGLQRGDPGPRSQRTPPLHVELLNQVKGAIGYVGNNLNQIAHRINSDEFYDLPELRLVLREILRIADTILVALGKDPSPELRDWDEFTAVGNQQLAAAPGAKAISIPADLFLRLTENAHAMATRHPSERPATGLEQDDTPPKAEPTASKFLPPEGHA